MLGPRAFVLLGYHFWKHLLRKALFIYDRGGASRFVDNYSPDRLLPVPEPVRGALPSWQRCTGCGRCDLWAKEASIMAVVGAGARDLSTTSDMAGDAKQLLADRDALDAAIRACPERVPIREVVAWVARSDQRVGR